MIGAESQMLVNWHLQGGASGKNYLKIKVFA